MTGHRSELRAILGGGRAGAHSRGDDRPDGAGQAVPMSLQGLSGRVNRVIAWADRLQRRHGTYYGFLSIFPLLLLGVAVRSRVLADHPDLRERLIAAVIPQALQSTVEHSLATLPTSAILLPSAAHGSFKSCECLAHR
jgi:hypothetical protein